MKIHDVKQNSPEWFKLRSGIPTASEMDALLSPEWKIRTGQTPETYLSKKIAEAWIGGPLPAFLVRATEDGNILEEEAKPFYSLTFNQDIQTVGFCTTDDGRVGASPDGLIGDDGGIEIKCPFAQTQVQYVLEREVPKEYVVQVQASMFVTGRPWWIFMSYRRMFPPLVLKVERNPSAQNAIASALRQFFAKFDSAMARMEEMNGGPSPFLTMNDFGLPHAESTSPDVQGDAF